MTPLFGPVHTPEYSMRQRRDIVIIVDSELTQAESSFVTPPTGLTSADVEERVISGRANSVEQRTSRTTAQIIRSNVLTFFNALLATLFVIILATGKWQNGLFGLVIVVNSAIGIFLQEVRAKRTLDRLAVLNTPLARVVRDGVVVDVDVAAVVADDLLELHAGDQIPADGVVRRVGWSRGRRIAADRRVGPSGEGVGR